MRRSTDLPGRIIVIRGLTATSPEEGIWRRAGAEESAVARGGGECTRGWMRVDAGGCGSSGRGTAAAAAARAAGEKAGVVAAAARLLHELVDVPVFLPDQPLLLERRAEAGEERLVLRRGA